MSTVTITAVYIEPVDDDIELDTDTGVFYRVAFDSAGREIGREPV